MKVQVNVNNATEVVSSHQVQSGAGAQGQALRLQAQKNVKYELVNEDSGFAPENIATKRVGQDLHIAFEKSDIDQPDLIIEGYYNDPGAAAIVGKAENGLYYNYVPESGLNQEAISQLGDSALAGQALGGEQFIAPFWVPLGVGPAAALGILPLLALGASGGGGDDDKAPADTTPPTLQVTINDDGTVTFQFSEPVTGFDASDVVVSNGGSISNLSSSDGGTTWTADLTVPSDFEGEVQVSVADGSYTDVAGNAGAGGSATTTVDTKAPEAPQVTINDGGDDSIDTDDLTEDGQVEVTVTPGEPVQVGDTITITVGEGEPIVVPVTEDNVDAINADGLTVAVDKPEDGQPLEVSATVTDAAGNESGPGSDSSTVGDTTAPAAPTVVINDGGDDSIDTGDLDGDGKVAVTVTPGEPVQVGDTITITVGEGEPIEVEVTEDNVDDINENGYTTAVDKPADGEELQVSATVTDGAGNESDPGEASSTVGDTTPTAAPAVEILADTDDDGWLNATELGSGDTVSVLVTVPADAQVGDTLTVSVNGVEQAPVEITAEIIADGYTLNAPVPAEGEELAVSATITDAAGNVSEPGSDSATVDTLAPAAPTVAIGDGDDGSIDTGDLDGDGKVPVTVTPGEPVQPGDAITVIVDGQDPIVVPVTEDNVDDINENGLTVPVDKPADGEELVVEATVTDAAGNESGPGSDSSVVGDTTPTAAPTVEILADTDDDGWLNAAELGSDDTVSVLVTVPADAQVGDTLTVTVNGVEQAPVEITAEIIADGYTLNAPVPAEGEELAVSATITDAVGNVSEPGSDSATVDTLAPVAPTVVINDGGDDSIDTGDLDGDGKVAVTVTPGGPVQVGDTITITVGEGEPIEVEVTEDNVGAINENGYTTAVDKPADGEELQVSATVTDGAGNESDPGEASSIVGDTTAPTLTVTINDDGTVTFQFSEEVEGFDADDVQVTNGSISGLVQDAVDPTKWTADLTPDADLEGDVEVSVADASYTDLAGNAGTGGSATTTVDTLAPAAPTVVINDGGDGSIDTGDLTDDGQVEVTVTPNEPVQVGDTITITVGEGEPIEVEVTEDNVDDINENGYTTAVDKPADGEELQVSATVTDGAGNESDPGEASSTVGDTTAPAAPTVVINDGGDDSIDTGDLTDDGQVEITVTPGEPVQVGDTITITVGEGEPIEVEVTEDNVDDINADGLTVAVDKPADGEELQVSATVTDGAGNESDPGEASSTVGDTTAPAAPTVVINDGGDDSIDAGDLDGDGKVAVTVTPNEPVQVGDTITITVGEGEPIEVEVTEDNVDDINADGLTVAVDKPADGEELQVSATVTDGAGNESDPGEASSTVGDTTAPAAPTVVINDGGDDSIDTGDLDGDGKVEVTVTPGEPVQVGDTITITVGEGEPIEVEVTEDNVDDINENGYTTAVDKPADGEELQVSATVTDGAGNESDPGEASSTVGDTTAPTLTVTINDDGTVTFQFSEEVEGFDADDVQVTNGSISGLVQDAVDPTKWTADLTPDADLEGDVEVSVADASYTDLAGNAGTGDSATTTVDILAPAAPAVTINDGDDGSIDTDDLTDDGQVEITVTPGEPVQVGDTITITVGEGEPIEVEVTEDNVDDINENGYTTAVDKPADGEELQVSATVTDGAGNESEPGGATSTVGDTTAPVVDNAQSFDYAENQIAGAEVATVTATDAVGVTHWRFADSGTDTSDDGFYQINNAGKITLTADGVAAGVANSDFETAPNAFTLSVQARDAAGNWSVATEITLNVTDVNDAPTITITQVNDFVEDVAGNEVGSVVATYTTFDEDGDAVTVTLSDTTNYALDGAGNVTLTAAGLALVNSGQDLPEFTLTPNDGSVDGTPATVDPSVTAVADAPLLILNDTSVLYHGATVISTGEADVPVTPGVPDWGSGVSRANLEAELGLPSGWLNNRFNPPPSPGVNHSGNVAVVDGKLTEIHYELAAGSTISWTHTFTNGENLASEIVDGYNDLLVLLVTHPDGTREPILVDASETKYPNFSSTETTSFTATQSGQYMFHWLVLNGGDDYKDSSLELSAPRFTLPGDPTDYGVSLKVPVTVSTDGSESLLVTISGVPAGATFSAGNDNGDGSWDFTAEQLAGLSLLAPADFTGDIVLNVVATATEPSNGDASTVTGSVTLTVNQTDTTISGTEAGETLNGTADNDLIRGYAGDDVIDAGAGHDLVFGGAGNDVLHGGTGDDTLYGGVGADQFVFDVSIDNGADVIGDFTEGEDKLVFEGAAADLSDLNPSWDDVTSTLTYTDASGTSTVQLTGVSVSGDVLTWLQDNATNAIII